MGVGEEGCGEVRGEWGTEVGVRCERMEGSEVDRERGERRYTGEKEGRRARISNSHYHYLPPSPHPFPKPFQFSFHQETAFKPSSGYHSIAVNLLMIDCQPVNDRLLLIG